MTKQLFKIVGMVATVVVIILGGILIRSARVQAKDKDVDNDESKIQQGFDIAPVPLNVARKNRALVGLGSYLVNGPGDCNACHNAGPGNNQFLPGGNPFFGQPKHINPATYLGGGRNFGQLGTPPSGANIISRNLTPDKTGLPSGGDTFEEFRQIMRTGVDFDHLHPTCPGVPDATCVPAPFNGNLLQVMPWPNFQNMTDNDLRAIYEYLRAIPCIEGPPAPDPLHHDCH